MVTGGTDGIGLDLCDQLAEQGFNICIISRNKEKIDRRIAELKLRHPLVKYTGVQADLSAMLTVAPYKELVEKELTGMKIGVVCLNAGCWVDGPVDLQSDADFERTFALNGLGVVYFAKALLPHLLGQS